MPVVHLPGTTKTTSDTVSAVQNETDSSSDRKIAHLGESSSGRRFWFKKGRKYDPDAIATQPSVYDNPITALEYKPVDLGSNVHSVLGPAIPHPIQVAWNSRYSNTVRSRTVSTAVYNMCVQASGIIASNIYRKDDVPRHKRENRVLVGLVASNIFIYMLTKAYYVWHTASRDRKWNAMSEGKRAYLATTKDEGNKGLDFRFAH
ncbi:hypothetical protein BDV38DRAFT_279286 [Aspergillus pseudotamarii]|uniref:Uncharacterized protein n=1 Tax=Aspergillus pseudotamarii TaxID=132259 RepID=A0A5N6T4Z9_ASPPS|nr:uncharacterized protein BDV38DRAFT_279286 [Aspergillus pseudotamarii]KAE8141388.1 hypothetical protein BDV38DRAFT_279286 [Aspergillus pseudotamarii]